MKVLFVLAGLVCLLLALIGVLLPVMPTTVFLIGAAICFARGSPALERRLLDHPRFGANLRAWFERGAIPRSGKLAACAGMSLGLLVLFCAQVELKWVIFLGVLELLLAIWIIGRPEPPP